MRHLAPLRLMMGLAVLLGVGAGLARSDKAADTKPTPESVTRDYIDILKKATEKIGAVKDKESAEKATAELKKQTERTRQLTKTVQGLGKLTDKQKEAARKLAKDREQAGEKFAEEAEKLPQKLKSIKLPRDILVGLGKALMEFGNALGEYDKAAKEIGLKD
jgi:hypothetical protein